LGERPEGQRAQWFARIAEAPSDAIPLWDGGRHDIPAAVT
jgi:hypothetical protein